MKTEKIMINGIEHTIQVDGDDEKSAPVAKVVTAPKKAAARKSTAAEVKRK